MNEITNTVTLVLTSLLVLLNTGLVIATLRSAKASKTSADIAAKEFRLSRLPIVRVVWPVVTTDNFIDIIARGRIEPANAVPLFLSRVIVSTYKIEPDGSHSLPVINLVETPLEVVGGDGVTSYGISARIPGGYCDGAPHSGSRMTGAILVEITAAAVGLGDSEETNVITTGIRGNATVGATMSQYQQSRKEPSYCRSLWQRWCKWNDSWRGESS